MDRTEIQSWICFTPRKLIELERNEFIKARNNKDDWWTNPSRSDWARNRYGETLTEKSAEEIYKERNGDISFFAGLSRGYCQICGENFRLDEEFLYLKFSFCDEYTCGITMHKDFKKCMKKISDKEVKENGI